MPDQKQHPAPPPVPHHTFSIVVADGEGDEVTIGLNEYEPLSVLLRKGLRALLGEPVPDPDDYDLLIGGTPVSDLSQNLRDAGLTDGSEVVIMAKDVSRG